LRLPLEYIENMRGLKEREALNLKIAFPLYNYYNRAK